MHRAVQHQLTGVPLLQELMAALVTLSVHSYRGVRAQAQANLTTTLKRLPLLGPGLIPTYLGILASVPAPEPAQAWQDSDAALQVSFLAQSHCQCK